MIKSFFDSSTEKFALGGKSRFSGMDEDLAHQRLNELNAAAQLGDLQALRSVGLHKLKGPLREFWSININGRWRLLFKFADGNAFDVQIADTH